MTETKPTYTHIQIKAHSRPIPITNTTITGSRFIKDTKTLATYCREWLAATKGESFTCLHLPAVQSYLLISPTGDIHFVQFAYQKIPLSPTQTAFRIYLNRLGHKIHIINSFQAFAAFIKKQETPTDPITVPTEPTCARLTAWGIQLPTGTLM